MSQKSKTVLRWTLGIALLAYIVSQLSPAALAEQFATLAVWPLMLSLLARALIRVLVAVKWYYLVRVRDPSFRFVDALAMHFIGGAAGVVLPMMSADAVIGYAYYRRRGAAGTAISTVLVDRVIGTYTLVFLAAAGVLLNLERFAQVPALVRIVALLVVGSIAAPLVLLWIARNRQLRLHLPERISALISEVGAGLRDLREHGLRPLLINVVLSFVTQLVRVLGMFTLALAVHEHPAFLEVVVLTPLIFLISMLPMTVGGLGFEQGAYIVLFGMLGISSESAFVMSVVGAALTAITVLPGALLVLKGWGTALPQMKSKPG